MSAGLSIHAFGLSHHDMPLEELGHHVVSREEIVSRLASLRDTLQLDGVFYLGTCNRSQFWMTGSFDLGLAERAVRGLLRVPDGQSLGSAHGMEAAELLMRIAGGLDSMLPGDGQILGQIKVAGELARKHGLLDEGLEIVLEQALRAARNISTETSFGERPLAIPSLAYLSARRHLRPGARVALVGVGPMTRRVGELLRKLPELEILVVNRTLERSGELARHLGAGQVALDDFLASPPALDLLVTATAASSPVFDARAIAAMRPRQGRLMVIDLAVPPDVAPEAGRLERVALQHLESYREEAEANRARRLEEMHDAEVVICRQLSVLARRLRERRLAPHARRLRAELDDVGSRELDRLLHHELRHLSEDDRRALQRWSSHLVSRMAGVSMERLKASSCARLLECEAWGGGGS